MAARRFGKFSRTCKRLLVVLLGTGILSTVGQVAAAPPVADTELDAYGKMPNGRGSGPYPALMEVDPSFPDHVVYRPSDLSGLRGRKLPVVVWGNGGCSADAANARLHLLELASHGYLVIAAGKVLSGPDAPVTRETVAEPKADGTLPDAEVTARDVAKGIDWAIAENGRPGSRYYRLINARQIAAAGRSCGGLLALSVAADPRVRTLIIHNSGTFPVGTKLMVGGVDGSRALLSGLRVPVLYVMGGPSDMAYQNALADFGEIKSSPVVLASQDVGHGGSFRQANGGDGARVAVAWLDWQFGRSNRAARMFTGLTCGLCAAPGWTVMRKSIAGAAK